MKVGYASSVTVVHEELSVFLLRDWRSWLTVGEDGEGGGWPWSNTFTAQLHHCRVVCALVNSFVPGTFTSEVLLNDR